MKQAAALLLLGLLGSALVLLMQSLAAHQIERQRQLAAERRLLDLLPVGSYDNHPLDHPVALAAGGLLQNPGAEYAYIARRDGQPQAVLVPVSSRGYRGPIQLLVAISIDGQLLASKVLAQRETPGLGDLVEQTRSPWLRQFEGRRTSDDDAAWLLTSAGGQVDQIAGATITSRASSEALRRALRFFDNEHARLLGAEP